MREINRYNTGHYKVRDQKSDREQAFDKSKNAAFMGEGVSFFERNSQYDKYHSRQGHGFAAEDANALNDTLHGRKVDKVGTDNSKNGADRIVDGVQIQVKYCKTPQDTVSSLFDANGNYRYGDMKIEVPKGQGEAVRQQLEEKAKAGKLKDAKGNTISPDKVKDLVKEGSVTYEQAKRIAKAGNVDSIMFDVKNSAITCSCVFGISFAMSMAQSIWSGKPMDEAVKSALKQSFAAGLGTLVISVTSQQLLRTSVGQVGKVASRYAVHGLYKTALGKQAIEKLATYTVGKTIYGAAAVNHVSKLLRSNVITGVVTTAVMTAPDFYRAAISGNASWKQLGKNLAVNAASVAGGTGGWIAGAAAGAAVGSVIPFVGTAVGGFLGGLAGALAGGTAAGAAAKGIADQFARDDADEMMDLCQDAAADLASEYMLTEQEMTAFVSKLQDTINIDFLRDMYGSGEYDSDREAWARNKFKPLIKEVVKARQHISLPSAEDLAILTYHSLEALEKEVADDEHDHYATRKVANA